MRIYGTMSLSDTPWRPESQPVSTEEIAAARNGIRQVKLTPNALPTGWLDSVRGLHISCLALGGG